MIVVDASVLVAWLLRTPHGARLDGLIRDEAPLAAPHLVDAEVAHTLRRHNLHGVLSSQLAISLLGDFASLSLERYAHDIIIERAFALRHNATIYDALYIALAEKLGATLLTLDRALTLVPNVMTRVEVID